MLTEQIRKVDVNVRGLKSTDGTVYLSPGLQGRIFCSIGDTLIHKLDFAMAADPSDDFNNIGGNSLWPAPEGGPFAFNYPHGEWTVQDGINKVCPELAVLSDTDASAGTGKTSGNTEKRTYVLNENTKKFHTPECSGVKDIKEGNKKTFTGSREELIKEGYSPCGRCKP